MQFIRDYMKNDALRHELNALAQETFGIDFEGWVQNGYFQGDYIPYSYEENGVLLANVSVNRMHFLQNGQEKNYIQLGTVMTRKAYRNRGLGRELMQRVLSDFEGKCDGIYLFANLDALGFYEKLGFTKGIQYRYRLKDEVLKALPPQVPGLHCLKDEVLRTLPPKMQKPCSDGNISAADTGKCTEEAAFLPAAPTPGARRRYEQGVRSAAPNAAFEQRNKYGLQLFYTSGLENVYYSAALDCYAVMELQDKTLYLQSLICPKPLSFRQLLPQLPFSYDRLILGFTPCRADASLFDATPYDGEEDYRFFYRGRQLESIEAQRLYFPELSHA